MKVIYAQAALLRSSTNEKLVVGTAIAEIGPREIEAAVEDAVRGSWFKELRKRWPEYAVVDITLIKHDEEHT